MAIEDLLHPLLGRYFAAPEWFKTPIGKAYSWLPERLRLGKPYESFRNELAATRDSFAAASGLATAKLHRTLKWAINTVPQYRGYERLLRLDLDPIELLDRMPVTDKQDIKRNPHFYLSRALPASQRLKTETGGSTGTPLVFYLHKHVTRAKEYAFMRDFRSRVGAGHGELTLGLLGRIHRGTASRATAAWSYDPIKHHLVFSPAHLDARYMPQLAQLLKRYRPTYIEGFPSMLHPIARWLDEHPLPEFTEGVKGVMLVSEGAHALQMDLFRRVFDCPVLQHYGHSERILMAATMPDDERYFFWPQYGWFELIGFDGRPVTEPGVPGEIVGTSFDNLVMPFVRYRTGDLAILSAGEHPRLPGYVACERIDGRLQESVVDRENRLISLLAVGSAHLPWFSRIEALQYEQQRPGELIMRYSAEPAFSPEVQALMAEAVGERTCCSVRLERVDRIPRTACGKQMLLVQALDVASYVARKPVATADSRPRAQRDAPSRSIRTSAAAARSSARSEAAS